MTTPSLTTLADALGRAPEFSGVTIDEASDLLRLTPAGAACGAWYELHWRDGRPVMSLCTEDRWFSESIEADLMHTGDDLDQLLMEELEDRGLEIDSASRPRVEHFRDQAMRYVFRATGASGWSSAQVEALARGFAAVFAELGDLRQDD